MRQLAVDGSARTSNKGGFGTSWACARLAGSALNLLQFNFPIKKNTKPQKRQTPFARTGV